MGSKPETVLPAGKEADPMFVTERKEYGPEHSIGPDSCRNQAVATANNKVKNARRGGKGVKEKGEVP